MSDKKNIGLKFNTGTTIGRWDIPDPDKNPHQFLKEAKDIGYHIALGISRGATSCEFVNMEKETKGGGHE